jgi:hypothetical protein
MCRAKNGELLTNKNQVLARWKEHFEEVDLRDDGFEIDLPRREETERALKYLIKQETDHNASSIHRL